MNRYFRSIAAIAVLSLGLGGCMMAGSAQDPMARPAALVADTKTGIVLESLPPPRRKLDVSVYNFPDLTGQNKPNDNFAEFSRALTQGASAVLIDATIVRLGLLPSIMKLAGDRAWWLPTWLDEKLPLLDTEGAIFARDADHMRATSGS